MHLADQRRTLLCTACNVSGSARLWTLIDPGSQPWECCALPGCVWPGPFRSYKTVIIHSYVYEIAPTAPPCLGYNILVRRSCTRAGRWRPCVDMDIAVHTLSTYVETELGILYLESYAVCLPVGTYLRVGRCFSEEEKRKEKKKKNNDYVKAFLYCSASLERIYTPPGVLLFGWQ